MFHIRTKQQVKLKCYIISRMIIVCYKLLFPVCTTAASRVSLSVGWIRDSIPERIWNFSLRHRYVQTGS